MLLCVFVNWLIYERDDSSIIPIAKLISSPIIIRLIISMSIVSCFVFLVSFACRDFLGVAATCHLSTSAIRS